MGGPQRLENGVEMILVDTQIIVAIVSATTAAVLVPAGSYFWAKKKERDADWQKYKFELYREFVTALGGIVGTDATSEGNRRFAVAANTLQLIASKAAIAALHNFQDEISTSNDKKSREKHDALLSRLIWEIRRDLKIPGTPPPDEFSAGLWCSGSADKRVV